MADSRTDQIAREAARLMGIGRTQDIASAIRLATDALGFRGAPAPGEGRVRKHAQAMSMQALGEAAYAEARLHIWRLAEQLMSVFEHVMPVATPLLVGRAAKGFFDAGVTIHIRLYTRASISSIADAIVAYGYGEPEFMTAETQHGKLNQIKLNDEGIDIVVTRCLPGMKKDAHNDLFRGKPIDVMDLAAIRRKLDESQM